MHPLRVFPLKQEAAARSGGRTLRSSKSGPLPPGEARTRTASRTASLRSPLRHPRVKKEPCGAVVRRSHSDCPFHERPGLSCRSEALGRTAPLGRIEQSADLLTLVDEHLHVDSNGPPSRGQGNRRPRCWPWRQHGLCSWRIRGKAPGAAIHPHWRCGGTSATEGRIRPASAARGCCVLSFRTSFRLGSRTRLTAGDLRFALVRVASS
jgi:hypothetical protein